MSNPWFEISNAGWRKLHAQRPLGALLCEALQNALDEDVTRIDVRVGREIVTIEDNGKQGVREPELVYTLFLGTKATRTDRRGRQGRGLKELISTAQRATLETTCFTVRFDETGRHTLDASRKRGTLLKLERDTSPAEIRDAVDSLLRAIPPQGVKLTVNGTRVKAPPRFASLSDCLLPTVEAHPSGDRVVDRKTTVDLFMPRSKEEPTSILEMGIPIGSSGTPWHLDVGQRIPRSTGNGVDIDFRLRLLAAIFEVTIGGALPYENLFDTWVQEAIANANLSASALRTFLRRRFPPRTVLASSPDFDQRAEQEGAHVVSAETIGHQVAQKLGVFIETSEQYLTRRQTREEEVHALHPSEERVLSLYRHLSKEILGTAIKVTLVRRPPTRDGYVENATFNRRRRELRINLLGRWDLAHPLGAESLALLFHELAHAETSKHDLEFANALGTIAGKGAEILTREGRELLARFGLEEA